VDELQALKNELATLKARLQTLEDHIEISNMVASYGPAADSGSAQAVADLFTADGLYAIVDADKPYPMKGHDEIAQMVQDSGHQGLIHNGCGHFVLPPTVEVNGDEAQGRGYALNIRWDPEAKRWWIARLSANTWTWTRTKDGWRIVERLNAKLDGSAKARAMLAPAD